MLCFSTQRGRKKKKHCAPTSRRRRDERPARPFVKPTAPGKSGRRRRAESPGPADEAGPGPRRRPANPGVDDVTSATRDSSSAPGPSVTSRGEEPRSLARPLPAPSAPPRPDDESSAALVTSSTPGLAGPFSAKGGRPEDRPGFVDLPIEKRSIVGPIRHWPLAFRSHPLRRRSRLVSLVFVSALVPRFAVLSG